MSHDVLRSGAHEAFARANGELDIAWPWFGGTRTGDGIRRVEAF